MPRNYKHLRKQQRERKKHAHRHADPVDAEVASLADNRERLLRIFAKAHDKEVTALNVAENVLLFDELKDKFAQLPELTDHDLEYQASNGEDAYNTKVIEFLNKTLDVTPPLLPPTENHDDGQVGELSTYTSTRCALEVLSQVLYTEAGFSIGSGMRGVMIPTPFWQGFAWVFEERCNAEVTEVPLTFASDYHMTTRDLEAAYTAAEIKPQILLLTQPGNPLGINYSKHQLETFCQWAIQKRMFVISDEIYSHCQIAPAAAPKARQPFTPIMSTEAAAQNPKSIHAVWGIAKDFGLSGFRVGFMISRDLSVQNAGRSTKHGYFSPMTSSNNWMTTGIFKGEFAPDLMKDLTKRITVAHEKVKKALNDNDIEYFEDGSYSAQFFWLNLSMYLNANFPAIPPTIKAYKYLDISADATNEEKLDNYIATVARVTLLRGETLSSEDEGFFRLCYTAESTDVIVEAVNRIGKALKALRRLD